MTLNMWHWRPTRHPRGDWIGHVGEQAPGHKNPGPTPPAPKDRDGGGPERGRQGGGVPRRPLASNTLFRLGRGSTAVQVDEEGRLVRTQVDEEDRSLMTWIGRASSG